MHVQGKGAISDMYKALIGFFDPLDKVELLDPSPCLPNPNPPNYGIYRHICK